jgi:L-ascorbate metabolism protein UlaG (beta-lactamase superfamily)
MKLPAPKQWADAERLIPFQRDTTDALRECYPDLRSVWDELDDLREFRASVGETAETMKKTLEETLKEVEGLEC